MNDIFQEVEVTRPSARIRAYHNGREQPWVVLVNGHTRPAADFRAMMRELAEHGYGAVAFDNRGSGRTTYEGSFTRSTMAEDILAVMDHVQIERAHLLGISMGGVLIQDAAASTSNRVKSLALVSTTCADRFFMNEESSWGDTLDSVVEKMRSYFSDRFFARNKLLVEAMCKQILKNVQSGGFVKHASDQKSAFKNYDTTVQLRNITCPVAVFHGTDDRIISAEAVHEFEKLLPSIRKYVYEGVGHLILAENPKQFYSDYLEFLGNVGD